MLRLGPWECVGTKLGTDDTLDEFPGRLIFSSGFFFTPLGILLGSGETLGNKKGGIPRGVEVSNGSRVWNVKL